MPLVIGTLAYKLQMVAAWAVGVMGSKEFRLYPSTTVSELKGGWVIMLLFSETMG